MAIVMKGYYPPGRKPEPSLHERLSGLKMAAAYSSTNPFAIPVINDSKPLPFKKGSCFESAEEKTAAHREWQRTYQKAGA